MSVAAEAEGQIHDWQMQAVNRKPESNTQRKVGALLVLYIEKYVRPEVRWTKK